MSAPVMSPPKSVVPPSPLDRLEEVLANHRRLTGAVLIWFTSLIAAFYYAAIIGRADMYGNDMAGHIPWTFRFRDPGLFPNDLITDYVSQLSPLGSRTLYRVASLFAEPDRVAEWSALPLSAFVLFMAYRIGKTAAGGRRTGGILVVALIGLRMLDPAGSVLFSTFEGGIPRSYAMPCLLIGTYGMMAGHTWLIGASCLLAALFYPPAALILGLVCGVLFLIDRGGSWRARFKAWLPALSLAALAGAHLATLSWISEGSRFGSVFTLEEALRMPQYRPGGPLPAVLPKETLFASIIALRFGLYPQIVILFAAAIWLYRRDRLDAVVLKHAALLWLAGLVLFLAAFAFLFRLYEPTRYVYLANYCASIPLAAAVLTEALDWLGQRSGFLSRLCISKRSAGLALAGFIVLGTVMTSVIVARRWVEGKGASRELAPHEIYAALERLPRDTLVAGHPRDVADISLLARRPVLVSEGFLQPYHDALYHQMTARLHAYVQAAYSSSWQEIYTFADAFDVDVMLVNRRRYGSKVLPWIAFYDREFIPAMAAGRKNGFALLNAPAERRIATAGDFVLVDVRRSRDVSAGLAR